MRIILILMFLSSVCWAEDIQLTSDYTVKKPNIISSKLLSSQEQEQVKTALHTGRNLIHNELTPVKNDYQNDFDRGTVAYTPRCHNYSFHKVIIPDGTTISSSNFSQKEPHTIAITGKNLTFVECNLVNNEIDPSWKINDCNTCQVKDVLVSETTKSLNQKDLTISHQVEQEGKFVEVSQSVETTFDADGYSLAILRLNK